MHTHIYMSNIMSMHTHIYIYINNFKVNEIRADILPYDE